MKWWLYSVLTLWSFFVVGAKNGSYSCQPISGINALDYNFDVIPIKKGDKKEIGSIENLDLSIYRGKIVLLSVFSENCNWCKADLLYHSHFQKFSWPRNRVVMVNLSFGPLINETPFESRFERTPEEMLYFVTKGHKNTQYGEQLNLVNVNFYHIVNDQTESSALEAIKHLVSPDKQSPLFPELQRIPYSVIIDENGSVLFRGHFTVGRGKPESKYNRHYGFIKSLVFRSCAVPTF